LPELLSAVVLCALWMLQGRHTEGSEGCQLEKVCSQAAPIIVLRSWKEEQISALLEYILKSLKINLEEGKSEPVHAHRVPFLPTDRLTQQLSWLPHPIAMMHHTPYQCLITFQICFCMRASRSVPTSSDCTPTRNS